METTNEKQLRVLTGLADIMPALRGYALAADVLAEEGPGREALDAAVVRLYRAAYAAGRRARPTDVVVIE